MSRTRAALRASEILEHVRGGAEVVFTDVIPGSLPGGRTLALRYRPRSRSERAVLIEIRRQPILSALSESAAWRIAWAMCLL